MGNEDFELWTSSDYQDGWRENEVRPTWSDEMIEVWRDGAPIESAEDMNRAIYKLFWWRESYSLEAAVMFRRRLDQPYIDPMQYAMCSEPT